jgi:hypothetical protein
MEKKIMRHMKRISLLILCSFPVFLLSPWFCKGQNQGQSCSPVYAYEEGPSFERLHQIDLPPKWAMLPRFSPDGRFLAYKSLPEGHDTKPISGFVTNIAGSHIHIIRADIPCPDGSGNWCEGQDEDITPFIDDAGTEDNPALGASFPTFSPDSNQIFYTAIVYTPHEGKMIATQQIFITSVEPGPDGKRIHTQLTGPPLDDPYISHRILHISKDSSRAAWSRFNSHNKEPLHDLFQLEVTICLGNYEPGERRLSECQPIINVRPDPFHPLIRWYEAKGLSSDGRLLYYSGTPEFIANPEIFVRPTSGGKEKRLTMTGPCVWDEQLAFSVAPAGDMLIFSSNRDIPHPCLEFIQNLRSPSFPFLPPMETYYITMSGGRARRMTWGLEKGVTRSTISINPADPSDCILFEYLQGEPSRITITRIRFPCE